MSSFRKTYQAVTRTPGSYVSGVYSGIVEAPPVGIMASVQPATATDYQLMQANSEGRRVGAMFRVYTATLLAVAGDEGEPGDILINSDGSRLLLIGKADRNVLNTAVSHFRYLAVKEIEHVEGENPL